MSNNGDIRRHSVTRGDVLDDPRAGVIHFMVGMAQQSPGLPAYWSRSRDDVLKKTIERESMWAAAITKAITKMAALGWTVEDTNDSELRTRRAQGLLLHADDNQGWVPFLSKHLRDFLLTDNGAFVEVVRASPAAGSKILGLMHLDSRRCVRTGDPEIPVLYRDRKNAEHELRAHQVLAFADMPNPEELYFGVGYCAASRAYRTISKLAAMETYVAEKVSGRRVLAIHFVSGLSPKTLESALDTAEADAAAQGKLVYRGALTVPVMGDTPVSVASVPLAELPDGFDAKQERDNAYVIYANAIGVAVQDIQPLSGQGLGTGTQTLILDEAAEGQGLAAWRKQWEHNVNEWVLPESTTFTFATNDIRDQKAKADVASVRASTRAAQIESGEIDPKIALQMAVDAGDVPREFLPQDLTPAGTLTDTQKPVEEGERVASWPVAPVAPVAKDDEIVTLIDQEFAAAVALLEEGDEDAE